MITNEQIEAYLLETGRTFTSPEENMWVIQEEDSVVENIVVYKTPPVVTFRVKLMEMPTGAGRAEVAEKLLRYNASDMVAGAYAIEDESIVIVDTLQLENLDLNELQASIDGLSLAVSMHYNELGQFRDDAGPGQIASMNAFDRALGEGEAR